MKLENVALKFLKKPDHSWWKNYRLRGLPEIPLSYKKD